MSQRDSGWIQLYAESNQEALDLHIQAFRLAEQLSLPVMVCMDGFILTHAHERVELPTPEQVDAFLPAYQPRQVLDPAEPVTIGAMVGPEAFTEVKYLAHYKQMQALDLIPEIAAELRGGVRASLRRAVAPLPHHDADTIVVALGSVLGTIEDVVDELREAGARIGCVGVKAFRPCPSRRFAPRWPAPGESSCSRRRSRSGSVGSFRRTCTVRSKDQRPGSTLRSRGWRPPDHEGVAASVVRRRAQRQSRAPQTFVDLDFDLVQRELERATRRAAQARTPRTSSGTWAPSRAGPV